MPFVYFIQEDKTDVFKIGITEKDVASRLRAVQVGSSKKLRIFGTIETTDQLVLEKSLHSTLRKYRLTGEWFKLNPSHVLAYFEDLKAHSDFYKAVLNVELNDIGKPVEVPIKTVYTAAPWKLFLFQANGMVLMTIVLFIIFLVMTIAFILHPDGGRMFMSFITGKNVHDFPR